MSDRLPSRRRSGGGRHVAHSAPHRATGWLQAGVAAALAAGLGLVAVNPALGGPALAEPAPDQASAASSSSLAADRTEALARRDATRQDLADAATRAVAQVADVRAQAQQAKLPAEQLAALDSVERRVDTLVARVEIDRLASQRVSRSAGRAGDDEAAPPAADTATRGATPTAAPSDGAATDAADEPPASGPAVSPEATSSDASSDAASASASTPTPDPASDPVSDPASDPTPTATASDAAADPAASDPAPDALPEVAASADPTAAALREAVLQLTRTVAQVEAATDAANAQAAAAAEAERAAWKQSLQGYANGRIPASALCAPSFAPGALLRCDAAQALDALDVAYRQAFGADLQVTDSYRSYGGQVACRRQKGSLCARPGTSNHGWGVAVDFGGPAHLFGTSAHDWLLAHAAEYDWTLPAWARADGSKPEPWHWEYVG